MITIAYSFGETIVRRTFATLDASAKATRNLIKSSHRSGKPIIITDDFFCGVWQTPGRNGEYVEFPKGKVFP